MPANSSPVASPSLTFDQSAREMVESIIVAVILAFLFRGFVAEAFVIPTGSMAPTLQGRHMDVVCSECGHQYRTGASIENDDFGPARGEVVSTRCPICRYTMHLDKEGDVNHRSFNGDRILVSKFAYQFQQPKRWDVIVFKYPGNARINYIKRLIGLPGETIQIRHGDVYTLDPATKNQPEDRQKFQIQRKPPDKVLALLQLVDDSRYVSPRMKEAGWPESWIASPQNGWKSADDGTFSIAGTESPLWLRYRHVPPRMNDWRMIGHGEQIQFDNQLGNLITDYYAYNEPRSQYYESDRDCWVGDLAVECDVEIEAGDGDILLDLVEGGTHFGCSINTASGEAKLTISNREWSFDNSSDSPTAITNVRGAGKYSLRFANVDDQLHLWVDNKLVSFPERSTTFNPVGDVTPQWTDEDPGDLYPVGIGTRGLAMRLDRLRVLRDVYYRAVTANSSGDTEYDTDLLRSGDNIDAVMSRPQSWSKTNLFASRRSVTFDLGPDQYFPLGDNSPQSKDARLWSNGDSGPPPYVERNLLIGKALAVYWPHGWRFRTDRVGFIPNFQRIGLIR